MQETLVGEQNFPDGLQAPFVRQCKDGSLAVSELLPRYAEHALRGRLFMMDSDSVTLAAANVSKAALATVKLVNGFFNPITSGKNAIIVYARIGTVSGTPGGPFFYNFLADSTINSAATGTIRSARLDTLQTSVMTAQTGVIISNAAAATTALKQLAVVGGPAAIAAGAGMYHVTDEVAGAIVVPPGYLFGLTCLAAGTTHIVQTTLAWLELPV